MPRPPRIHIEQGLYFITTRGDHADVLFKDDADREQYLALLAKYKSQYGFKLFAYVLMTKFVHLLIEMVPDVTISEVMHVINSTYTKYYNSRYDRQGHVFQGRFKASIVQKERFLAQLTRYIHLVPVVAHLAADPNDYKWSSYRLYMQQEADAKEVLKEFSSIPEEQIDRYKKFMDAVDEAELDALKKKAQRASVIGTKKFAEEVKRESKEKLEREALKKEAARRTAIMLRKSMIGGSIAVLLLSVLIFAGFVLNQRAVKKVATLVEEREAKIKEDVEGKYRDDMVSYYHAMVKRLEREKK